MPRVRSIRPRSLAALLVASLVLLASGLGGCAGAPPAGVPAGPLPLPHAPPGRFQPPFPPVTAFDGAFREPWATCAADPAAKAVSALLAASSLLADGPRSDGRLCALAAAALAWPEGERLREEVVDFLSGWVGLPTPALPPIVRAIPADPAEAARLLLEGWQLPPARGGAVGYGVAVVRPAGGPPRAALVVRIAPFQLEGAPRSLDPGQAVVLQGTLLGELANPRVRVSDAQGQLDEPSQAPGRQFVVPLRCGDAPGRIVVEVRADEQGRELVLPAVEIACAAPLPATVALEQEPWPPDLAAQERRVGELVNSERQAAGRAALVWLPAAATVARALSEVLRDTVRKAGPRHPVDVPRRLAELEVVAKVLLQTPAAAADAETALRRLLRSPQHRVNVLSPEVNHLGVGVALGEDGARRPLAFLTLLELEVPPPPDLVAYKAAVREVIARKRAAGKAEPVTDDAALDQLAQEYATAVAAAEGRPSKATYDALVKALNKTYKTVDLLTSVKHDPADFAEEPNLLSRGKLLGLGAALGKHPAYGKNSVFLVMLIATRR